MDELPIFRANKRRKFARHKDITSENDTSDGPAQLADHSGDNVEAQNPGVSNVMKIRKQNKSRTTGIQFSQQRRVEDEEISDQALALTKIDPEEERLKSISNRFIGSTGQVVDVDKHMMAYIDSEIAKRNKTAAEDESGHAEDNRSTTTATTHATKTSHQGHNASRYPSQLQLSEFDLGTDAHVTNLARTSAALARAQSGVAAATAAAAPTPEVKSRKPRKPRLGRDGKPLRPRARKRRNSEDAARDALVEQMLHEHKVDVYDGEPQAAESEGYGEDEDADERLAEQFKQDFMDAMVDRRQRHQAKAANSAKAKAKGPDQSGPKLGGSRSMRAKMAQMQQSQQSKGTA